MQVILVSAHTHTAQERRELRTHYLFLSMPLAQETIRKKGGTKIVEGQNRSLRVSKCFFVFFSLVLYLSNSNRGLIVDSLKWTTYGLVFARL